MSAEATTPSPCPASWAEISDDGQYRYVLGRRWGSGAACMTFVMLNPSTADAEVDDPTIRRCIGFAKREGHDGLMVVNLFAYRSSSPAEMAASPSPLGPDNQSYVMDVLRAHAALDAGPVVAAWGAFFDSHSMMRNIALPIARCATKAGIELRALGLTKSGEPQHPLYISSDAPLVDFKALA